MKKTITFLLTFLLALSLAACSLGAIPSTATQTTPVPTVASAAVALTEKNVTNNTTTESTWETANAVSITFNGETITADGEGVKVDGSTLTIVAAGTYSLSGTLNDGQVIVETESEAPVRLVLNGVSLASSTSAPLNLVKAKKTS